MSLRQRDLERYLQEIYAHVETELNTGDAARREVSSIPLLFDIITGIIIDKLKSQSSLEEWTDIMLNLQSNILADPGQLLRMPGRWQGRSGSSSGRSTSQLDELSDHLDPATRRYLEEKMLEQGHVSPRLPAGYRGQASPDQQLFPLVQRIVHVAATGLSDPLDVLFRGSADSLNHYRAIDESMRRLVQELPGEAYKTRRLRMAFVERLSQDIQQEIPNDAGWFERKYQLAQALITVFQWLDQTTWQSSSQKDRSLQEIQSATLARNRLLAYFFGLSQRYGFSSSVAREVFLGLSEQGLGAFLHHYAFYNSVNTFLPGLSGELAAGLALQQQGVQVTLSDAEEESSGVDLKSSNYPIAVTVKSAYLHHGPLVFLDLSNGTSLLCDWLNNHVSSRKNIGRYLQAAQEIITWSQSRSLQPIFALSPQMFNGLKRGEIEYQWIEG